MIEETQRNVDFTKVKLLNQADSNSYSQSSNHNPNKPARSIFIDQAPKSYRSGSEPHQVKISDFDPSQGMLTSRESQKIDDLLNLQLQSEKCHKSEAKQ